MTNLRQAAQQALEALKGVLDDNPKVLEASISGGLYEVVQCRDAITALRTALEQQAEPVAQREWVGLTEFQFAEIYNKWNDTNGSTPWGLNQALEARLKELNT